jgi:hypothetical protein
VFFAMPSDEFPHISLGCVAILADQQDAAVGEDGKHDHGAGVNDHLADGLDAAGLEDVVAVEGKDSAPK